MIGYMSIADTWDGAWMALLFGCQNLSPFEIFFLHSPPPTFFLFFDNEVTFCFLFATVFIGFKKYS